MIVGIDLGAKKAGTSVIARLYEHNKVDLFTSEKGMDADQFILDFVKQNEDIWLAYLDAPLSLPKINGEKKEGGNSSLRKADELCGTLSPMALGELTTRAMKLSTQIEKEGVKAVETYPSKLAEVLHLKEKGYKGSLSSIPELCDIVKEKSHFEFDTSTVCTWHHFDALLCLFSAKRHEIQAAMIFGDREEGIIIV